MEPMQLRGRWLLLTGASAGLGREMALQLARDHGAHLVLVARREDRLRELAARLEQDHRIKTDVLVADLARPDEVERVFRTASERHSLYCAVLNAGVTHFGDWDELDWNQLRSMIDLNVVGTTRLATLLVPYLEQRGEHGGLLLVASMAGLTPLAYQTVYSATKAYLVHFGCGLWHEMMPRGVSVTTFAPGGIDTEMTAGQRFNGLRSWLVPPDVCAREGILALTRRDYLHIPGAVYRAGSVLTRLLPQRLVVGQVAARYRKSLLANR